MDGYGLQGTLAPPARGSGQATTMDSRVRAAATQMSSRRVLLWAALAMGFVTHGYHLFVYPLYITDEGIYMEQIWSRPGLCSVKDASLHIPTFMTTRRLGGSSSLDG